MTSHVLQLKIDNISIVRIKLNIVAFYLYSRHFPNTSQKIHTPRFFPRKITRFFSNGDQFAREYDKIYQLTTPLPPLEHKDLTQQDGKTKVLALYEASSASLPPPPSDRHYNIESDLTEEQSWVEDWLESECECESNSNGNMSVEGSETRGEESGGRDRQLTDAWSNSEKIF